jgi:LmbE family N-acetylglucosaminyl deacetylase
VASRIGRGLRTRSQRSANALRDRSFRSRIEAEAGAPAVVLSPHLDDAVLDCWSVLTGPAPVRVVNVFTGAPPPGVLARWDRICRARADSATQIADRAEEDRAALALAQRTPVNLGFPEVLYRPGRRDPLLAELDAALTAQVPALSVLYAPADLGSEHPDHRLVRAYALALARQGVPVRLYADAPYCIRFGWPAWVTGTPPDPHLDVDAYWEPFLEDLPRRPGTADVVRLTDDQAAAKLEAIRAYETQLPGLDQGPAGIVTNPANHRFEVVWTPL